jgi:hypothetical protein
MKGSILKFDKKKLKNREKTSTGKVIIDPKKNIFSIIFPGSGFLSSRRKKANQRTLGRKEKKINRR